MSKKLLALLFLLTLTQQSFAGSQSYQEYLDDLEKVHKDTAERVKAAYDSIVAKTEDARNIVKYGLPGSYDYTSAVKNAEKFGKEHIRALTVIDKNNPNITWDHDKKHVLVVSWMPEWAADAFYKPYLGKEFTVARDMWVTVSPEIKKFIKSYKGSTPLHYRLEMLMGLPIKAGKNYFVESWVKPSDLIRPCINKEVTDPTCEPDTAPTKTVDGVHKKWFTEEKAGKYSGKYIFPWTRLGYTYDTAKSGSADKFGLTEFVILPGKKIQIKSITPTDQYVH